TSRDLLHWSTPSLMLEMPILFAYACGAPAVYAYPSVVAANAETRHFGTTSDRAYLYATRFNMTGCKLPMDRDLVRFPVTIGAPRAPSGDAATGSVTMTERASAMCRGRSCVWL